MTATDRDGRVDADTGGVHKVHSAVPSEPGDPDAGLNARPRGRPRESSGESAQPQAPSAHSPDEENPAPSVTWSDRAGRLGDLFTPPDIWSADRPALSKVWSYAAHGEWTTPTGAPRRAGQLYAVIVAVPARAAADITGWVFERPARLTAAVVLLLLLAQIPPLKWLI